MTDKPKPKLTPMQEELQGEHKLWRRTTFIVLMTAEPMEITKVHAVTRYAILVSVKGREQPHLIQKHAIAYAMIAAPAVQPAGAGGGGTKNLPNPARPLGPTQPKTGTEAP